MKHGEYPNPAPRERDSDGRNYSLEIFIMGLLEQCCPAHQVLNSNRMVQIILSPERNPDAHEILSPPPRRFWRLKAGLAALLMASAVIGLVLAALFLGSIIAALLVILVVIVSVVVAIKAVIRHAARIREKRHRYVARDC